VGRRFESCWTRSIPLQVVGWKPHRSGFFSCLTIGTLSAINSERGTPRGDLLPPQAQGHRVLVLQTQGLEGIQVHWDPPTGPAPRGRAGVPGPDRRLGRVPSAVCRTLFHPGVLKTISREAVYPEDLRSNSVQGIGNTKYRVNKSGVLTLEELGALSGRLARALEGSGRLLCLLRGGQHRNAQWRGASAGWTSTSMSV
jgi:hypothetical protein